MIINSYKIYQAMLVGIGFAISYNGSQRSEKGREELYDYRY